MIRNLRKATRGTASDAARSFVREEGGAVLILWAMFLAVAFGFLALSFDLGRVNTTQTQLQSFADQVALAAAGELDGRPDAIDRATRAAQGLVADEQAYATGSQSLGAQDFRLTFLRSLPASDSAPATDTTTDGRVARYAQVIVNQRQVPTPFAAINAALNGNGGANQQSAVSAVATAGFTSWACDVTPLFFCAPDATWRAKNNVGQQIQLRTGNGSFWGPGNFGFLDPTALPVDDEGPCAGKNGAQLYRCLVGAERAITSCIQTETGLATQPGQRQGLADAFNTRFDIYRGAMQSEKNDINYRPAPNTVQGTAPSGGSCRRNNPPASDASPLPRDPEIIAGASRFGSGNWDRAGYVASNHGGSYPLGTDANSTRYEMYLAEIAAMPTNTPNVPLPLKTQETGLPQCHNLGPVSDPERRVLVAAAIDCSGLNSPTGSTTVIPLEYVKVFMTEPVGATGNDFDIMVEVVDTAGGVGSAGLTGVYQDFIQLYR